MVSYRRDYTPGAAYFFTLTLKNRRADYLTTNINALKQAYYSVKQKYNFSTKAFVILPDHIHLLWKMQQDESNYSTPIRLIKTKFSNALLKMELPLFKNSAGKVNLWQNRFWEHRIKDEEDYQYYIDYIHYNPVKHGYVHKASDWPYSSIHHYINIGMLSSNWGVG